MRNSSVRGGEFMNDISDILQEPVYMPQCAPKQHNNNGKKSNKKKKF
jgi:hypothetical protein